MHPTADDTTPAHPPAPAPDEDRPGQGIACWPSAVPEPPDGPLVGRSAELAELRRLALDGESRFITLVGIGGVGKSRLAAELAIRELGARDGRIAFVALDAVGDASLVLPAIAGALGVREETGRSLIGRLSAALDGAPTLLVLDTVEHVRAAAPDLASLVARTPELTILATSRIALGVPREHVLWVEPLPVPGEGETEPVALEANPTVELFLERASAVRSDLRVTPANAALVSEICRRLDGIPLAVELAAAALHVLAPHQLLDQLAERLTVVDSETAGAPERQRSLRAAMDWSIGLLAEPVLRLYRRLGVIASSFHPSTAASILERGERRGVAPLGIDVGEGLRLLGAASLLRREDVVSGPSYTMLSTVRADALDRLERSGEAVAMRWAHAYEVLALVEAAERDLPTEKELDALERLESGHDDIREALDWATSQGDGAFAVRLAGALAEFWRARGHHTEGRLRLAAALAIATDAPATWRRKALSGAGLLASYQGDYALGESYLREALAVATVEGDEEGMASALNILGTNAYGVGDLEAAERLISDGLALRRRIGDLGGIATALNSLGGVQHFRGQLDAARERFRESLEIKKQLGNPSAIAVALTNFGLVERDAGRPQEAAELVAEAIDIWERGGDRQRVAIGLHNMALIALDQGRLDEAVALLDRVHAAARELGDRTEMAYATADRVRVDVERGDLDSASSALAATLPRVATVGARVILPLVLEGAGALAAARGEDELAGRLWGAAHAERTASGFVNMPADERLLDRWMAPVRERLGAERFTGAWAEGQAMTLEAAVDAAMALAGLRRAGRPASQVRLPV